VAVSEMGLASFLGIRKMDKFKRSSSSRASAKYRYTSKIQEKAIRIVTKSAYNSHTAPLFLSSGILPLKFLIAYFKILFMYDYNNSALPVSFTNLWMTNHNVRNAANVVNVHPL
jgi:hypothetical protein